MRGRIIPAMLFLVAPLLCGCGVIRNGLNESFLYPPDKYDFDLRGIPLEEVCILKPSGAALQGWFVPAQKHRTPILVVPGNGGAHHHTDEIAILHDAGFPVLTFNFSGFGRSEGTADIGTITDDALAALDYLLCREDVDSSRIGIYGVSLGSVVALHVASQSAEVGAVAVFGLYDAEKRIYEELDRQMGSVFAGTLTWLATSFVLPDGSDVDESLSQLSDCPVLFMHGERDSVTPLRDVWSLYPVHKGPQRVWILPGTGHAMSLAFSGDEKTREFRTWLASFFEGSLLEHQEQSLPSWKATWDRSGTSETTLKVHLHPDRVPDQPVPVEVVIGLSNGVAYSRILLSGAGDVEIAVPGLSSVLGVYATSYRGTPYVIEGHVWDRKPPYPTVEIVESELLKNGDVYVWITKLKVQMPDLQVRQELPVVVELRSSEGRVIGSGRLWLRSGESKSLNLSCPIAEIGTVATAECCHPEEVTRNGDGWEYRRSTP